MAIKRVRLIGLDGVLCYECDTVTDNEAIIFTNRVFLRSFVQGTWQHFREVSAERVRVLDTARVVDTSLPLTQYKDNENHGTN